MRVLLCTVCILASLLVSKVNCQEDEDEGTSNFWQRFKAAVRKFVDQLRELWDELKSEVQARTSDMADWSREMWSSFKEQMYEWIDRRNDISDSEKSDMRDYIERLKMPEEESE